MPRWSLRSPAAALITLVAIACSDGDDDLRAGLSPPSTASATTPTTASRATTTSIATSSTPSTPSSTTAAPTSTTVSPTTTTTTSTTSTTTTTVAPTTTPTTTAAPTTMPVAAGPELPGGGHVLFPHRRLVALYGHPGDGRLGVLGEQPVSAAVDRARQVAAEFEGGAIPVIPTFEIITTVASSEPGPDGDYSLESSIDHVRPWVDAARAEGFYVVLELQPGHTDFLTQAQRYEELLAQPHVGLGLDPEWRLAPGERHLEDVGQVSAEEVNRVAGWLAELTRRHGLPQKMLLLQQFRLDMLPDRDQIVSPPELAVVVQMDGFGPQNVKLNTWRAITQGGPPGAFFGWKQFYDEDRSVRAPADVIALEPSPVFVSYQ